jgi:hypothetical protein
MTAPRSPEQRARFIRVTASDLDVAPELAEQLLLLSESARTHRRTGALDGRLAHDLLDILLDDDVCQHAWRVAATEGQAVWRWLFQSASPPRDVGPAVLLAFALARAGAADEAMDVLTEVVRAGEFRRTAIEMLAELAEDAGQPVLAWVQVTRLGLAEPDRDWGTLRCVLGCSSRRQCERSRLAGVMHARWLRARLSRWVRRPWSGGDLDPENDRSTAPGLRAQDWRSVIGAYVATRKAVLPVGERELLEQWSLAERVRVTVIETSPWEGVVLDESGECRLVGWESTASSYLPVGSELSCWVLPTLVPAEHLLVRWMVPTPW